MLSKFPQVYVADASEEGVRDRTREGGRGGGGELPQISLGDVASLSIMRQSVFRCQPQKIGKC